MTVATLSESIGVGNGAHTAPHHTTAKSDDASRKQSFLIGPNAASTFEGTEVATLQTAGICMYISTSNDIKVLGDQIV